MRRRVAAWVVALVLAGVVPCFAEPQMVELGVVAAKLKEKNSGSLLSQELVRQAMLIAAREELGAVTRDDSLREVVHAGDGFVALDAGVELELNSRFHGELTAHGGKGGTFWTGDIACKDPAGKYPIDYCAAATTCEALSRGAFVDALKKAGVSGQGVAWTQEGAPTDSEERLQQWNVMSQYWLLRELHGAIRASGESPLRLSALSRAYAQMGVSTEALTGGEYAVYSARGLLYAERLMVKDHGSALALRTRAYARALAGLPGAALADLDAAEKVAGAAEKPEWVDLVRKYCHYDTQSLLDTAGEKGAWAGVAGQLAFMTVENMDVDAYRMRVARQVLENAVPCDGLQISEFMCDHSGPGWLNQLVDLGPATAGRYLPYYFSKMPGAPVAAVEQAKRSQEVDPVVCEEAVGRTLDGVEKREEPSWSMMGRLLQEFAYTHVWRKAELIRKQWGVSADDYLATALPLVANHPLQPLVAYFGSSEVPGITEFMERDFCNYDLSPAGLKFYRQFSEADLGVRVLAVLAWRRDHTATDCERILSTMRMGTVEPAVISELLAQSPDSPQGIAALITKDWGAAEAGRKEWEPRVGRSPVVARAMAQHSLEALQYGEAAKWAREWAAASPDVTAYRFLASIYRKQNKMDQWQATLEEFLQKGESYGLESAAVQVELANYLMGEGKYAEAEPYAHAAAETASAWGLQCAQYCEEGLGKFDDAEKLVREESQHYDTDAVNWYLWCRQFGRGQTKEAREYFKQSEMYKKPKNGYVMGPYDILENDPESAIARLEKSAEVNADPWIWLHLALLYDEAGKTALRDRALAAAGAEAPQRVMELPGRQQMIQLAKLFKQCLAKNSTTAISERSVGRFMQGAPGEEANLCYFIGRFLELHGRKEDAKVFYAQSVWSKNHRLSNMALSGSRLMALGVDPTTALKKPAAAGAGSATKAQ